MVGSKKSNDSDSGKTEQEDKTDAVEAYENSGAAKRADDGTGLQSLAVDREIKVTDKGDKIGDEEGDPRRFTPVAGKTVIGHAESGEPIVAGGVETMTSGVPADAAGLNDPTIGVAATTDAALANHEATRDEWYEIDESDSDGSPVDRLRSGKPQNPTSGGTATEDDSKYKAKGGGDGDNPKSKS
jgi:hypothetical protein